jgi:hypothetical protein
MSFAPLCIVCTHYTSPIKCTIAGQSRWLTIGGSLDLITYKPKAQNASKANIAMNALDNSLDLHFFI